MKWVWFGLLLAFVIPTRARLADNVAIWRQLRWWMFGQAVLIIAAVIAVRGLLLTYAPLLGWSWLSVWGGDERNVSVIPIDSPILLVPFLVLLFVNLPRLARSEEESFRKGTRSWPHALGKSVVFGLVHCLVGVSIATGLAIGVSGLWYSHHYFVGGVERSTHTHTAYNAIVLSVLIVVVSIQVFV